MELPGGRLDGCETERFGVFLAVMPGQDLAGLAGLVRDGAWQIWQRMTGSCEPVTGKLREFGLLITSYDASPLDRPGKDATDTRAMRQMSA